MKKVLSLVLVLTLVLGSFSMVFATTDNSTIALTDVVGNANEEAITVVNDLGIVTGYTDGTFKPANNVTRAEFAAMMTRALAIPESALAGYATTSFKDVAADNWAVKYLAFCDAKGIMLGDGNGNAMPNRTINVNEAVTMILRAIGYTNNSAVLVGSWPSNYVTLAQDRGIYKDVAATATVDRASAAQIVYNALSVGKVQVATDGTTTNAGANMLTSGLKCTVANSDVIVGNESSLINLKPYQGAKAKLVYNEDNKVVAVMDIETTFLTVDSVKADTYIKSNDVKYYTAVGVKTTAPAVDVNFFANGEKNATTLGALAVDNGVKAGDVVAVKLNGTTVKEIVSVLRWTNVSVLYPYETSMLNESKAKLNGLAFDTNADGTIDEDSYVLVGAASLNAIPEDAVVYVYRNTSAKITKVMVATETVTGLVEKIDSDNNVYVNGTAYKDLTGNMAVGDTGTAALDPYGDVYDWTVTDTAANNYAVIYDLSDETKTTAAGSTHTYSVMLDDMAGEAHTYVLKIGTNCTYSGLAIGDIVKYALNSDGKVNNITTVAISTASITGKLGTTMIGTTPIKSTAVFWAINDDNEYDLIGTADFDTTNGNAAVAGDIYGYVKDGYIVAAVVLDTANMLDGGDVTYGVINDSYTKYEPTAKENYWFIEGYADGTEFATFNDSTDEAQPVESTTSAGNDLAPLYKFKTDSDGFMSVTAAATADFATVKAIKSVASTTTVEGISNGMVKYETGSATEFYALASGYTAYVWNAEDEVFDAVKALATNDVKGNTVVLIQSDDDVQGYDIVLVW